MSLSDENELIRRFQGGDNVALEELWNRYKNRVFARIRNILSNSNDVPDVVLTVLINIFRGLRRFQFRCKFSTWLYPVVGRACLDQLDKNKQAARVFESAPRNQTGPDSNGDEQKDQNEFGESGRNAYSRYLADVKRQDYRQLCLAIARSVLEKMSPRKRKVIQLIIQKGYNPGEVAHTGIVNKPAQATQIVHDYRERCRKELREVIENRDSALAARLRNGR